MVRLPGSTLEDVKGWGWESVHDSEILPRVMEDWKRSIATGQPFEMEFPLRRHDGRFQWFLTRATPLRTADGSVTRWFGTNTNIEEIRNIRLRSEEANRAKDEFLAMLSHELRAPLNLMAGWSQILKATDYQEDLVRKAIDVIFRNVELQSTLIEDLLDVSRIVSERIEISAENVLLDEIVRETVQVSESLAGKKEIKMGLTISASPIVVNGDRGRLAQIVQNLLNNSLKFTPDGGKINIDLSIREGFACLGVTDNGIGIADEMLPFIFEKFRQADTTSTRAFGGLGLGLTIVESLVKMHGGRVSARSEGLKHGAEFLVEIPLASVHARPSVSAAGVDESEVTSLAGSRVLLVDDDPDSLDLMAMFLELEGMTVTRSSNVADAIKEFESGNFELVISDLGMPDMDGYDLIREVRSIFDSSRLPAIALTGFVSESDRATVTAAGFQAHVAKPVEFERTSRQNTGAHNFGPG